MRTPLELRNDAIDCLRQADRAQARRHKAMLLILAQGWASLAEEMERRGIPSGAQKREAGDDLTAANDSGRELQSAGAN